MLLEGSSVRVLQCSPLPNWHGCRLQLLFQTVLPTCTLQLVFLSVSCRLLSRNSVQTSQGHVTGTSWIFQTHLLPERMKESHFFLNTGKGIWLSYVYFGSNRPSYTRAVFNSSGARLRELCQWGGTKLSQGDFLLAHLSLEPSDTSMLSHECPLKHAAGGGHLSGCFNAPHFLLTRVPSSTPFPNSLAYIQIAACLLICVLPSAFKKFCSNKQGHVTGTSWIFQTHLLPERMKESHFFLNTGKGIWLSYVYFGSNRPSYTRAVFNSSGARLRELCQWGGTKLSQGDFLLVWRVMLAHYHWNLVIHLCYIATWQTLFIHCTMSLYRYITALEGSICQGCLLHIKAGPTLPYWHGCRLQLLWFWSKAVEVFPTVQALQLVFLSVDPAGCFQEILFKQARTCHWKTSLARILMHLEQIWAVRRLVLGLHAQKNQCFVLDSWIITVTAEKSAKLAFATGNFANLFPEPGCLLFSLVDEGCSHHDLLGRQK